MNAVPLEPTELPYIIQDSEGPVFVGTVETDVALCCVNCGHVLIRNYDSEDYAAVCFKCFKCGTITCTPPLPVGEVLCANPVTLGHYGRFRIRGPVTHPSGKILTIDQEVERELQLAAPRNLSTNLDLTPDGLRRLKGAYDSIVGALFDQQTRIVLRGKADGSFLFPFAWAVDHLHKSLTAGVIDVGQPSTATSLIVLQMFVNVLGAWGHHPRFNAVAKGLGRPRSFYHTASQLITAAYLYQHGNRVGLSLENIPGRPNPDLYMRGVGRGRFFLEVKAPEPLQWSPANVYSKNTIESTVASLVKKSRNQIDREHHGALVIASTLIGPEHSKILAAAVTKALQERGRSHRQLSAVITLSPTNASVAQMPGGGLGNSIEFGFELALNPSFEGPNPLTTQATPAPVGQLTSSR